MGKKLIIENVDFSKNGIESIDLRDSISVLKSGSGINLFPNQDSAINMLNWKKEIEFTFTDDTYYETGGSKIFGLFSWCSVAGFYSPNDNSFVIELDHLNHRYAFFVKEEDYYEKHVAIFSGTDIPTLDGDSNFDKDYRGIKMIILLTWIFHIFLH